MDLRMARSSCVLLTVTALPGGGVAILFGRNRRASKKWEKSAGVLKSDPQAQI